MKNLMVFLLVLFPATLFAQVGGHLLVSTGTTMDRQENQTYQHLQQQGIAAGLTKGSLGFRIEGLKSSSASEEGNLAITTTRHWWTTSAIYSSKLPITWLSTEGYLGAGLGAFQDVVEMELEFADTKASGHWNGLGQILTGLRLVQFKPLAIELEARLWGSPQLDSGIASSVTTRIGIYF